MITLKEQQDAAATETARSLRHAGRKPSRKGNAATADAVIKEMKKLSRDFPPGLVYEIAYNPTEFIDESVKAVKHTVYEAIILVVIVIIFFLQSWRAAVIPIIAIPVSLIGTFAAMAASASD